MSCHFFTLIFLSCHRFGITIPPFYLMDLRLFFTELPSNSVLTSLDKRIDALAKMQEPIDGGRRLWITHVPETITRPFLNPKPFDILVSALRFSNSEIEDFRMEIGVAPKRCMICRAHDETHATIEVLFAIVAEIMTRVPALLAINDELGRKMFRIHELEPEFPAQCLDDFPGCVYEVAHENSEGDLTVEWFVDGRWLKAWLTKKYLQSGNPRTSENSRFASLDYV